MSLVHRGRNRWAIVLGIVETDPATGARKRKQKWVAFRGTREEARIEEGKLLGKVKNHEFTSPSKITVGEWLDEWLEKIVKPTRRPPTYKTYQSVVRSLKAALGYIRLQQLRPLDVQHYFTTHATLSAATLHLHHSTLSAALKAALDNDPPAGDSQRGIEAEREAAHRTNGR